MTIEEAIEWIHSRLPFGSRPGLDRVEALLEKIGNPENEVPTIHIAGTNGKGSTVAYLRNMLMETGLKVGTFTSPYIETFNERIAINDQPISDETLIRLVEKYQPLIAELDQQTSVSGITEFETLTAMALDYFLVEKVDIAIIEVGLGGLLDSTNVVKPLLTGITTIGLDHTDILGDTLADIAYQKAGIIKEDIPVVVGNVPEEAFEVIETVANEKHAELYRLDKDYFVHYEGNLKPWGEQFAFDGPFGEFSHLQVSLIGKHQIENAAVAIQLYQLYCQIKGIEAGEQLVYAGLKAAKWPARMEKVSEKPLVILDGAHNPHAINRLVENMQKEFSDYHIHILFSALSTKNVEGMLAQLQQIPGAELYLTTFEYPKAIELSIFNDEAEMYTLVSLWQFGLAELLEKMTDQDLLLVTGSLYFVSQVRNFLFTLEEKNGN